MRLLLTTFSVALALSLAGCGQKGPLELSADQKAQAEAEKKATATQPPRQRGEPPRKSFPLDPLL
jgi:predicted small lipoprotein YifL